MVIIGVKLEVTLHKTLMYNCKYFYSVVKVKYIVASFHEIAENMLGLKTQCYLDACVRMRGSKQG